MKVWRSNLTYFHLPKWTINTLDAAEELVPFDSIFEAGGDKYVDMATWLYYLKNNGLLTISEYHAIRIQIADCL